MRRAAANQGYALEFDDVAGYPEWSTYRATRHAATAALGDLSAS